ncbi:MAG: transferase hexapeptide repeat family protein [Phycisphaerales bacterium]|jgi:phenylacetic acid degradation protein|nr:transferase hexapeptide repeat family protein [Phycisphaerales bacterium]
MPCYEYEGIRPVVDPAAFVHPTAVLIGDVIIGPRCLVGPAAVLRGDIGRLELKDGSNVQDTCVVHCFPGKDVVVHENGHVGHGAVLHGCTIGRNALVGMNAVLMDDVSVGENSIVGALSFVKERTVIPPNTLWAGSPARQLRELSEKEVGWKTRGTEVYQHLADRHLTTELEVDPLSSADGDRLSQRVPDVMYETKRTSRD